VQFIKALVTFIIFISFNSAAFAAKPVYVVELKNHLFYPSEINIPANTKVILVINNNDSSYEQFDSFDLNREKVIFAGKKANIYIGPLPPGKYKFFGEFHPNTAQGVIVVGEHNANFDGANHVN
jgi:hypothetical protein